MIEKFIVTNSLSESLELELKHPEKSGIYVKEVTGLGYPSSNVSITSLVTSDIGHYNQSIYSSRNVVFTLGFLSDVENNRQKIYDAFIPKMEVKVDIITDVKELYLIGIVETCEPNIFSEDETIQVSLICPNPYLIGINPIIQTFIGSDIILRNKREIEQGYDITIKSEEGMDNVKIEYENGSILYGRYEMIDLTNENIDLDSNTIKPGEKLLISTKINDYGVYLVDEKGLKTEITEKCRIKNDFPILYSGVTKLNCFANGITSSETSRNIISREPFYYTSKEDHSYVPTSGQGYAIMQPWEIRGGLSSLSIPVYGNTKEISIYLYDQDIDRINSFDIEFCIGKITISNIQERENETTDGRNSLKIFAFLNIDEETSEKPALLGREYYNNGIYGDYVLFQDVKEEKNSMYIGEKEDQDGLVDLIYKYRTHGVYGLIFQSEIVSSGGTNFDFEDISSKLKTTITYPDYHNGL